MYRKSGGIYRWSTNGTTTPITPSVPILQVPRLIPVQTPAVVQQFIFQTKTSNQDTGASLSNYITLQSTYDNYAEKVLNITGQYVTTISYQDRPNLPDSNSNLNIFLQISHINDTVNSIRGVELGGNSIMVVVNNGQTTPLPNSAEIKIPSSSPVSVTQKVSDTLNPSAQPIETPKAVLDFLNNNIDIVNKNTGDHLAHYILVQTVPDVYSQKNFGIAGQYITTLAFEDRYGRADSNGNLNVFLQISHTASQVNSLRGIQLGGDDIGVIVNGVDEGKITKTVEIPMR
jgi:hypothetical protein